MWTLTLVLFYNLLGCFSIRNPIEKGIADSIRQLALNKEKSNKPHAPYTWDLTHAKATPNKRRIYFVRHGESEWNVLQNAFTNPPSPKKIVHQVAKEVVAVVKDKDSKIIDAPLSAGGIEQAKKLGEAMENNRDFQNPSTVFITSNLRRALFTALDAFALPGRVFRVHSALQEITNKPDGVTITIPVKQGKVEMINDLGKICTVDTTFNAGQKSTKSQAADRVFEFCNFVFNEVEEDRRAVVVVGHSHFFQFFFDLLIPGEVQVGLRERIMKNTEVVGFDLYKSEDGVFVIDSGSIRMVYGGL